MSAKGSVAVTISQGLPRPSVHIFSHYRTQTYAIPFNFLGTVIVNEKQYCNASNYNEIPVPQD